MRRPEADGVIPLEVKSGVNARSKSLASYRTQFSPSKALRTSLLNLKADDDTVNLPFYLMPALHRVLGLAEDF